MKKKQTFDWPGKFTFVDVEIPNIKNDSVCAVSMIVAEEGKVVLRHTELINPRSFFSSVNVSIHHITPQDIQNKRTFLEFWSQYGRYFSPEYTIVAHNALSDINVIDRDLARSGLGFTPGFCIDTMDLVYDIFYQKQTEKGDLKLNRICEKMNIPLEHHNPASDVNACFEIFHYLYQQGFRDLDAYVHEVRLKSRAHQYRTPVKKVSAARMHKDIQSRQFRPYFAAANKKELNYQPYFDQISLLDLQSVCLLGLDEKNSTSLEGEVQTIREFVGKIGGKIVEEGDMEQACCVIEFLIPKAEDFLFFKKKGVKLFHSLDVMDFIKAFENNQNVNPEMLLRTIYQSRLANHEVQAKSLPTPSAVQLGLQAWKEKDWQMAVYYLELAAARGSGNLRIYRLLADLYHTYGFLEEEKRVLKKGIRTACRRRCDCRDLRRRYHRIEGKEVENSEAGNSVAADHRPDL